MITEELIAKIKADISYRIETYIGNAQSCVGTTLIDGLEEALDILSTLKQEEPDKSLEEAAYKYSFDSRPSIYGQVDVIDAFKAGAEWQKEQDDKETADLLTIAHLQGMEQMKGQLLQGSPMPEDTVLFNKGVEEGRRLEREDMLKDAVEGYVNYYEDSGGILMAEAQVGCPYHSGDKIRIVVLKAEE